MGYVFVYTTACTCMVLCVCTGCYFVVLFVIRVFFLFFFSPQFVLIKLCKNPKQHHVHNCLNNFIWLVLAAICLNVKLCGNWMPKQKILNSPPPPPLLSPFFPSLLLQAFFFFFFWFLFLCFYISIKSQSRFLRF